ncbi:Zinc finger BED domain-containing protein RICESLEEPER 2, partial [Mucuna pruriens]
MEISLRSVEHEAFCEFLSIVALSLDFFSCTTLAKMKKFLSQHRHKVCFTTDTWTSSQNLSYIHSGKTMVKMIGHCLRSWGLNRVLTLTVDNASSNDVAIQYLKKWLMSWNNLVMKGDYLHMRCCAHILNLVVKDGFKENIDAILRIRAAVKYIRSSRLSKFKCVEQQNIESKSLACLDV